VPDVVAVHFGDEAIQEAPDGAPQRLDRPGRYAARRCLAMTRPGPESDVVCLERLGGLLKHYSLVA
jgi:hypothetical protein